MTLFLHLTLPVILWIQRYRVRFIDADIALPALVIFGAVIVLAIIVKWMTRDPRQRY